MKTPPIIAGERFGMLVVIELVAERGKGRMVKCRCDCGMETVVRAYNLFSGNSESCGCRQGMAMVEAVRTHGQSRTPIYRVWLGMHDRCTNEKRDSYVYYGARGIKVCDRWAKFENFLADMGTGYERGLLIDRIDNDGNYEPDNCRWATPSQSSLNRRPKGTVMPYTPANQFGRYPK